MRVYIVMFIDGAGKSQYEHVRALDVRDAVAKLSQTWDISKVISVRC